MGDIIGIGSAYAHNDHNASARIGLKSVTSLSDSGYSSNYPSPTSSKVENFHVPSVNVIDNGRASSSSSTSSSDRGSKMDDSNDSHQAQGSQLVGNPKRSPPTCSKCKNHLKDPVILKGHKKKCPYKNCDCGACAVVENRREAMADSVWLTRQKSNPERHKSNVPMRNFRKRSHSSSIEHQSPSAPSENFSNGIQSGAYIPTPPAPFSVDAILAKSGPGVKDHFVPILQPWFINSLTHFAPIIGQDPNKMLLDFQFSFLFGLRNQIIASQSSAHMSRHSFRGAPPDDNLSMSPKFHTSHVEILHPPRPVSERRSVLREELENDHSVPTFLKREELDIE